MSYSSATHSSAPAASPLLCQRSRVSSSQAAALHSLPEPSVTHILRHSAPSPHGQGYATVVDAAVRSSHEVDPALVSFANPDWSDSVMKMALQAASELFGEPADAASIGVSLYKLLCYRPGDHFLPHRDTEHDEGMFATLVVQLPSACKGGALRVSHLHSDTTHDFGEASGRASSTATTPVTSPT